MTRVAVADAGPLIHLGELGAIDLLTTFETLVLPTTVREELVAGGEPDGFETLDVTSVTVENPVGEGHLDAGERAALSVALDRDALLLTDDLDARDAAAERGVPVRGSLGVIALACSRSHLTTEEASTLMRALQRETSLFVSEAVVERGIELLDG